MSSSAAIDAPRGSSLLAEARPSPEARGLHFVCARVAEEFLKFTRDRRNDLVSPRGGFPGLGSGDSWRLWGARWAEAERAGIAPTIDLAATHEQALRSKRSRRTRCRSGPRRLCITGRLPFGDGKAGCTYAVVVNLEANNRLNVGLVTMDAYADGVMLDGAPPGLVEKANKERTF